MQKIVFTDLDQTLTQKDTFFKAVFFFGDRFRLIFFSPIIIFVAFLSYLKIISRDKAKKFTFYFAFKNKKLTELNNKMNKFIQNINFNQDVLDKIADYQNKNYKIIVVSASLDFYVKKITQHLNFDDYICTDTNIENGKLVKISGYNCNYIQKAIKIKKSQYFNCDYSVSFGNSKGDYEMFKITDEHFMVKNGKIIHNYLNL